MTAREAWNYFGYREDIRYIILPRKRDRNGNKFGFIKVGSMKIADRLIEDLDGSVFLGFTLHLKITSDKNGKQDNFSSQKLNEEGKGLQRHVPKDEVIINPPRSKWKNNAPDQSKLIVEQPKHKHFYLETDENRKEERQRSVIGITQEDTCPDLLQEKISLAGYNGILVRGITYRKFLILF